MKILAMVLVSLVILAIGIFVGSSITGQVPGKSEVVEGPLESIPHLSTEGFVEAEISVEPAVIYLTSNCYSLAMITNELQTYSIEMGLNRARGFRPLTHDLVQDMIETFEIEPLMVKIESLEEGAYFAKLLLKQGNRILNMDSKPSDAIAIAVRTNIPVYINQALLEENGEKFC